MPTPPSSHGPLTQAVVPISSAQLLAIKEAPITAVAGVPGSMIVPVGLVTFEYVFVTTPYVDHAGNIILNQPNVGSFVALGTNGWWTAGASQVRYRAPTTTGFATAAQLAGTALTITQDTADPTGGDGTVVVSFCYCIVPLS